MTEITSAMTHVPASQTNEDRLFVNWRPISSAPRDGTDILIAIENDGVYFGWNYIDGDIWTYSDINYPGDTICEVPETKVLGWMPIPTLPKEKII